MEKEFYSIRELQTIFGCGRNKIYQIVRTEEFPKIMIGKKIYIPINEFNEWKKNIGRTRTGIYKDSTYFYMAV